MAEGRQAVAVVIPRSPWRPKDFPAGQPLPRYIGRSREISVVASSPSIAGRTLVGRDSVEPQASTSGRRRLSGASPYQNALNPVLLGNDRVCPHSEDCMRD